MGHNDINGPRRFYLLGLRSRWPVTGVSRALRARSVPGVSPRVSPKMGGVRRSVRRGVAFGPRAPECPKSVPRVPPECQKGVRTLQGHSRDTFWTLRCSGPEGPRGHPVGHSVGHPPFSGTLSGTLREPARETPVAGRRDRNLTSSKLRGEVLRGNTLRGALRGPLTTSENL